MKCIPAVINNDEMFTLEKEDIISVNNELIAQSSIFPLIRISTINRKVEKTFEEFQAMKIADIFSDLKKAAQVFRQMDFELGSEKIDKKAYIDFVVQSTGLTAEFVEMEIEEVADIMEHLEEIVTVQIPGSLATCLDEHYYETKFNRVGYYPAGKSLAIKLPGNVPTICMYWLIPFTQKRPIYLIPPQEDLLTHYLILQAIRKVNPKLASFIYFLPCRGQAQMELFHISDQIMAPESSKSLIEKAGDLVDKTYFIHYGRSKILNTNTYEPEYTDILYKKMTWNNGRTCTGLTSVVTTNHAQDMAEDLAKKLIENYEKETCIKAPSFTIEKANMIDEMIEEFVKKGEVIDITKNLRNKPRVIQNGNRGVLFPTVLLVKKKDSKAFGLELPFPFVSIIELKDEKEIIEYCKHTLILSVISEQKDLVEKLCYEKSILKVFSGEFVERGYHYLDPHEGYMLDFLNVKKAILL